MNFSVVDRIEHFHISCKKHNPTIVGLSRGRASQYFRAIRDVTDLFLEFLTQESNVAWSGVMGVYSTYLP